MLALLCRGEVYPVETDERLCDILETGETHNACACPLSCCLHPICDVAFAIAGQEVEVDLEKDVLTVLESGKQYPLKSIGEVQSCVFAWQSESKQHAA